MKRETINEFGETVITMTLGDLEPLTDADRKMLRSAAARPVTFDEDCPPMSEEMIAQMEQDISEKGENNQIPSKLFHAAI